MTEPNENGPVPAPAPDAKRKKGRPPVVSKKTGSTQVVVISGCTPQLKGELMAEAKWADRSLSSYILAVLDSLGESGRKRNATNPNIPTHPFPHQLFRDKAKELTPDPRIPLNPLAAEIEAETDDEADTHANSSFPVQPPPSPALTAQPTPVVRPATRPLHNPLYTPGDDDV